MLVQTLSDKLSDILLSQKQALCGEPIHIATTNFVAYFSFKMALYKSSFKQNRTNFPYGVYMCHACSI
jgi:hypothetical protein